MIISIDYDETYTRDPELWNRFIRSARARGHMVYCVTMRHEREAAGMEDVKQWVHAVYFTGRRAKEAWCRENNILIDVWIDDSPLWLTKDAL